MSFCAAKTKTGEQCGVPVSGKKKFCFFHDPSTARKRAKARRAGGKRNRVKSAGAWPSKLAVPADAIKLLEAILADLAVHDENSIGKARAGIALALAAAEIWKIGAEEERISALEKIIGAENKSINRATGNSGQATLDRKG